MKGLESWKSYQHTEDIQMERNLIVQGHLCVFVYITKEDNIHLLKGPSNGRVKGLFSPAPKSRIMLKMQIQAQYKESSIRATQQQRRLPHQSTLLILGKYSV